MFLGGALVAAALAAFLTTTGAAAGAAGAGAGPGCALTGALTLRLPRRQPGAAVRRGATAGESDRRRHAHRGGVRVALGDRARRRHAHRRAWRSAARSSSPARCSRRASPATERAPAPPRRRRRYHRMRTTHSRGRHGHHRTGHLRLRGRIDRRQAGAVREPARQGAADRQHREQVRLHAAVRRPREALAGLSRQGPGRDRLPEQPVRRPGSRRRTTRSRRSAR